MTGITVIILTFNEERHIERAIRSVELFASRIIVVDSFSTDRTCQLATGSGATVVQNKFVNQAKQFQWALQNGNISSDWVMRLDADEVVEPNLASEIMLRIPVMPPEVTGIILKRKHVFLDKWIRFGGRFPLKLLRIWRTGAGYVEDRWMDEHILISYGKTVEFKNCFADHNLNDLSYFVDKHNKYATREAIDRIINKYSLLQSESASSSTNWPRQALVKRWIKENFFNRLPYQFSASAYFIFRYFFQLGFVDGAEGFIYHALQGWWYRFLVGAKLSELDKALASEIDAHGKLEKLSALTGFSVNATSINILAGSETN